MDALLSWGLGGIFGGMCMGRFLPASWWPEDFGMVGAPIGGLLSGCCVCACVRLCVLECG